MLWVLLRLRVLSSLLVLDELRLPVGDIAHDDVGALDEGRDSNARRVGKGCSLLVKVRDVVPNAKLTGCVLCTPEELGHQAGLAHRLPVAVWPHLLPLDFRLAVRSDRVAQRGACAARKLFPWRRCFQLQGRLQQRRRRTPQERELEGQPPWDHTKQR